jgi:NADH dehydrogenase/NADH:ubiquinone oxidoreductase subunit G
VVLPVENKRNKVRRKSMPVSPTAQHPVFDTLVPPLVPSGTTLLPFDVLILAKPSVILLSTAKHLKLKEALAKKVMKIPQQHEVLRADSRAIIPAATFNKTTGKTTGFYSRVYTPGYNPQRVIDDENETYIAQMHHIRSIQAQQIIGPNLTLSYARALHTLTSHASKCTLMQPPYHN